MKSPRAFPNPPKTSDRCFQAASVSPLCLVVNPQFVPCAPFRLGILAATAHHEGGALRYREAGHHEIEQDEHPAIKGGGAKHQRIGCHFTALAAFQA